MIHAKVRMTADLSLSLFTSISTSVIGFPVAFTDHILERNVFLYFFVLKRFMLLVYCNLYFILLSIVTERQLVTVESASPSALSKLIKC